MSRNPDHPETARAPEAPHQRFPGDAAEGSVPFSFEAQILALLPQLRRYSRSLTRSAAESEDLLQDCVEKALISRSQWRGSNFKAWAYRIMTNLHLNTRRASGRRPVVALDEAENAPVITREDDPLERSRLTGALETLPSDARAVLMLVVVEGYAYQEVADMLDIPIGTVMSRLSRARHALREKMREENVIPLRRPK
ncbi:RNA polymerase sigma factor [Neorhizobium alkalisoli]|uniref:RNA polymerase sigma-70 factor (ECF subfamily) n=1 Tax=Neorhizobium alkalisoli TaxID=528178 RepID=A0A561QVC6_9HYPH|nr:RNA polymerase sigma factor [Neorhizobium alkalisoli]TWF54305.1 RNA polymerase sigma-70 factor (ECF subfamily) [Neorhizobium alkalisoli]